MPIDIIDEGQNNVVTIDECPNLRGQVTIKGDHNTIKIGSTHHPGNLRILLHSDSVVDIGQGFGFGDTQISIIARSCFLKLGNAFVVNGSIHITMHEPTRFTAGQDCLIASGALFMTSDVHGIYDLDSAERTNYGKDIEIGDHVWIGGEAIILKGARIGSGSIVANRALVSGPIPPCSVAGGVPAKVIKSNVTWHPQLLDRIPEDLRKLAQTWRP